MATLSSCVPFSQDLCLDNVRGLLDSIITSQIKNNEYVVRKGAKLLIDCNRYFHLQSGCYSMENDDMMVETSCMTFYYQTFFLITEQIFTLFKASLLFTFVKNLVAIYLLTFCCVAKRF